MTINAFSPKQGERIVTLAVFEENNRCVLVMIDKIFQ
jgi:hypothetical protein